MTTDGQNAEQWIILPGTTIGGAVGIFKADFTIRNRSGMYPHALNGVVDTGASHVIIPERILDEMEVARDETALFSLADGSHCELAIGEVLLDLQGRTKTVQVVFGASPRKILLGAMALEAFGLAADSKNHRLIPAELTL